jgi:hypothetical protein
MSYPAVFPPDTENHAAVARRPKKTSRKIGTGYNEACFFIKSAWGGAVFCRVLLIPGWNTPIGIVTPGELCPVSPGRFDSLDAIGV